MLQQEHDLCRLLWGRQGVREAVRRGDIVVVVDILRFSSAAVAAAAAGVAIVPAGDVAEGARLAAEGGAELAGGSGRFSLSPRSFAGAVAGSQVVLPSPNGSFCCRAAADLPAVFVGALLNASATADAVMAVQAETGRGVTVLACGERFDSEDGSLRFALEDFLGAGAILARLELPRSPDAEAAVAAFRMAAPDLAGALAGCGSGLELAARGQADDIASCLPVDRHAVVVRATGGRIATWQPGHPAGRPEDFPIVALHETRSAVCERILRSLPDWFGIPEAIADYARDVASLDTFGVIAADREIGFAAVKVHNAHTGEIHVMGIEAAYHGRGLGKRLIAAVEEYLVRGGRRYLTVKTLSARHPDPHYARTRQFYERVGFVPVEEFPALWGEANPCVQLIKAL